MTRKSPNPIDGLLKYLSQPEEKANEDLVLSYFRHVFGEAFSRQKDAKRADGYVPGHFVLELKGDTNDWLSGLIQAIAYQSQGLDFSLVVVAAKHFLAVWDLDNVPASIRKEIQESKGAPSAIGKALAKKFTSRRKELLKTATWTGTELFDGLFASQDDIVLDGIKTFENTLKAKKKVRQKVTPKNFTKILSAMKEFFDPKQPMKTVRAFYTIVHSWNSDSKVEISQRNADQATLGGEVISNLIPSMRMRFKAFVEGYEVSISENEDIDDFFAKYDQALDAVDPEFRKTNGIFFTDPLLSKFALWFARTQLGDIGDKYLVIDPACGSGNLVSTWRTPLELRHKVVSEIEPEMLFAIERRMRRDEYHKGRFTVVPRITEEKGLNFLDKSAEEYLQVLTEHLTDKGHKPNKPLAFLCNPPYRNDDDQSVDKAPYEIHPSIAALVGPDATSERYCPFLAQMKRICEVAEDSGLPDNSLMLVFTKSAWLTKRQMFLPIRREILSSFEDVAGFIVNGKEFFDLKGSFPIAFTIWRYKGKNANLDVERTISLTDLTSIKRSQLETINWESLPEIEKQCKPFLKSKTAIEVPFGHERQNIYLWSGQKRFAFQRLKRKPEIADRAFRCGLPEDDERHSRKWTLGESTGDYIGFMDDLTPCRIKKNPNGKPWFRLNSQFMDFRKTRCFSGPADQKSYTADTIEDAKRMFFWFALGRTFSQTGYPMWADAEAMWGTDLGDKPGKEAVRYAFAIGMADNECIEVLFPANNPVRGAKEIIANNPMTPLEANSYWNTHLKTFFSGGDKTPDKLVDAINGLFFEWKRRMKGRSEIAASYDRSYFVTNGALGIGAGLIQIKDFALETDDKALLEHLKSIQALVKQCKEEFYDLLMDANALNYFGSARTTAQNQVVEFKARTKFEHVLYQRLSISALLVSDLNKDKHFGRTKLAKLFYLVDMTTGLDLKTEYYREAAGPLDQRALYNEQVGIESMARKYGYFGTKASGPMIRYLPGPNLDTILKRVDVTLGKHATQVREISKLFSKLDTDQCEIIATLYACWNDLLLDNDDVEDELIVSEFLKKWHPKKQRFPKVRLLKALDWMKQFQMIPKGKGKRTHIKDLG